MSDGILLNQKQHHFVEPTSISTILVFMIDGATPQRPDVYALAPFSGANIGLHIPCCSPAAIAIFSFSTHHLPSSWPVSKTILIGRFLVHSQTDLHWCCTTGQYGIFSPDDSCVSLMVPCRLVSWTKYRCSWANTKAQQGCSRPESLHTNRSQQSALLLNHELSRCVTIDLTSFPAEFWVNLLGSLDRVREGMLALFC